MVVAQSTSDYISFLTGCPDIGDVSSVCAVCASSVPSHERFLPCHTSARGPFTNIDSWPSAKIDSCASVRVEQDVLP